MHGRRGAVLFPHYFIDAPSMLEAAMAWQRNAAEFDAIPVGGNSHAVRALVH